ncbi:NAD(P)(+) transhydrogenase (Re/Si-specific) subunit beta [Candidatus Pelagibacter ubique]|nr:NAD(P)(+) transhydrogenase (Re/Si-specific) subunit beta [Candidatus Pelagibacter ubique]
MSANLSAIFYLVSGVLFILALRGLSSPETSRQGNFFGILGMVIAITVTFLSIGSFSSGLIYVLIFFTSRWTYRSIHSLQDTNDSYARISGRIS